MAETQKKYVDLNGLGYAIRKINNTKADIESPVFTGTPKIGENNITATIYGSIDTNAEDYISPKDAKIIVRNGNHLVMTASVTIGERTIPIKAAYWYTSEEVESIACPAVFYMYGAYYSVVILGDLGVSDPNGTWFVEGPSPIALKSDLPNDYVNKKDYVTDPEIQDMIDEILDGEGEVVDKVSYAQLVARVEALEALVAELLKVNVNGDTLVFTME